MVNHSFLLLHCISDLYLAMISNALIQLGQQPELFDNILISVLDLAEPHLCLVVIGLYFGVHRDKRKRTVVLFGVVQSEVVFGQLVGRLVFC